MLEMTVGTLLKRVIYLAASIFLFCPLLLKGESVSYNNTGYVTGFYDGDPLPDKTAYLTFDDGPSDWTGDIIDILEKERINATFFVCGLFEPKMSLRNNGFKKYHDVMIRMIRNGNAVGNHTSTHKNIANFSNKEAVRLFKENQKLMDNELGIFSPRMTLIRTPKGVPFNGPFPEKTKKRLCEVLKKTGVVIMWSKHFDSTDSMDWVRGEWYHNGPRINMNDSQFKKKMRRIYTRLITRANGKGIVVLFHDTHPTTADILKDIIDKLKSEGYGFATMEDYVRWRWHKSSAQILAGGVK